MSNFTDFFPAPGGGGGGILKQQVFTTSGSVDLTSLGIADGDVIQLFLVGGGRGGSRYTGGQGSDIWSGSLTVGTAGTATVVIGAGGAANTGGGTTYIEGGGIPSTYQSSPGHIPGGRPGETSTGGAVLYGSAGFGQGGLGYEDYSGVPPAPANTGQGGGGGGSNAYGGAGGSGIAIIYYS